ncbi:hypothetical protein [Paenibacillus camerounensis]|uniref:hypothetical protein n=1 Tax=Paenibacillus camerounensis TaxID=1243663 RepID=UPI0005A895DB|nr:hypothetical protein [Paenibacillus camerounensis]
MKNILTVIVIVIMIFANGCSNQIGSKDSSHPMHSLPADFTTDKIQRAFDEYVNYRLWFYPKSVPGNSYEFDSYVGQKINAEIRLYASAPDTPYIHTDIGDWLAIFKTFNGFVYCDGIADIENSVLSLSNYEVIDRFTLDVKHAHTPNYGVSETKEEIIKAIENNIQKITKDLLDSTDRELWEQSTVYLTNFYEYEQGVSIWFVREDHYVWQVPVSFIKINGIYETQSLKGYGFDNLFDLELHDPGRYTFEKQISDAVKIYKIDNKQLTPL